MLDRLVGFLVGLGIPGFILFVLATTSGLTGAAAIVAALAALGPGGMVGGLVAAGVLALISAAVAEYGFAKVLHAVLQGFLKAGTSKADLLGGLRKVKKYIKKSTYNELVQAIDEA